MKTHPVTRTLLAASLASLLAVAAAAATRDDLADPALALRVDDRAYPVAVTDIMYGAAKLAKKELTYAEMLDGLVDNQLMAREGVREMGRDKLLAADKVGFAPSVMIEDQFATLAKRHFYKEIDAAVRAQPGGNLDGIITRRLPRDHASVKELMTLRDRGEVRLTPAQLDLARKTVLATLVMPDGTTHDLTWFEMYQRQNVQGRTRLLQENDFVHLDAQVRDRAEARFVEWWVRTRSGLTAANIALLRTMLEEKFLRETYMLQLGVVTSMHEDTTPTLARMQKEVTKEEVRAWYARNKEEFRQVEKVRARHIRCADEAACKAARAAVEKGMPFAEAVRRWSIAPDKSAAEPGSLGWIRREEKNLPWLHQVALIQHQGEMTQPIRSPEDAKGIAVWEVVLVDERVEGYSPVDSETVRYQAAQEIAKQKLVTRYLATRDRLKAAADIRRNGALLRARDAAPAAAAGARP